MKSPFVAHRGEPVSWPENSLAGYQAVLEAGADFIETDIQITADGVAVLNHDPTTLKITGVDLQITATDFADLHKLSAGYADRFGERFSDFRITRLDELVSLLKDWPQVQVFVELKQATLTACGIDKVVEEVMAVIQPILPQCILISFNHDVLGYIRKRHTVPIGWVLHEWSETSQVMATSLSPDYLFCDYKHLPATPAPLWDGPWFWAVYTVNDASDVPALINRGIDLVETDVVRQLLADKTLQEYFVD